MRMSWTGAAMTALALAPLPAAAQNTAPRTPPPGGGAYEVPVDYRTLPNGLKVALSRDTTAPLVVVAVYYNIGFRSIEPKKSHRIRPPLRASDVRRGSEEPAQGRVRQNDRRPTAASPTVSTRFDFTNYYEVAAVACPSKKCSGAKQIA